MYAKLIGRIDAEPYGAADTGPTGWLPGFASGWPGRYGARCFATAIGPMPGPPPPCGMQNVLWRFKWQTSAPTSPGRASPTIAFMFAPSRYTWPPYLWTIAHTSLIVSSKTPYVDG